MLKMFFRAMFFLVIAVSYVWCKDKVVITGAIIDSLTQSPIQGLQVSSFPVPYGTLLKITTTDAAGKYSLLNDSSELNPLLGGYCVSYNHPGAGGESYQSGATTITVPGTANRNDNIADTVVVNFIASHHTPPPDTLLIKGRVVDTSNTPIANAQVKFVFMLNGILHANPPGVAYSYDTLFFTTGADGVFMSRSMNVFALTGGSFAPVLPAGFDAAKNKPTTTLKPKVALTADTTHASLFDGNLDSIIVADFKLIPGIITAIHFQNIAAHVSNAQNPVNVSIYSIDGRLVGKIDNVKIEALDNMLSSLNLFRGKVMLAQWSQNGVKCSKRIMNLTKNNNLPVLPLR